ncbi:MAG: trans-sulfuration enzyme family protein [Gemmobacter sp.]
MPRPPLSPATIAAQAGGAVDAASGGVVPPIPLSTTFLRGPDYAPLNPANTYARDHSDIVRTTESVLAALEGAAAALLFPSGMAAIAALFRAVPAGAPIVLQSQIYWGTTKWVRAHAARHGHPLTEVDASDADALSSAIAARRPALVFIETPSNPWLRSVDIAAAAQAAHATGAVLAVDATAATPILTRPLDHGADIVMHSATKGINGHSDVLAGVLAARDDTTPLWQAVAEDRQTAGAVLGPFEAWLLLRGIRTLPLRVDRMSRSAQVIAEWLAAHPQVTDVYYPGLPGHPGHAVAQRQMTGGYGCLLSFLVRGDREAALAVVGRLNLFHRATSLGGVESLVEHRHSIEPHTGIPPTLIRASVGLEDPHDLIADLAQALS